MIIMEIKMTIQYREITRLLVRLNLQLQCRALVRHHSYLPYLLFFVLSFLSPFNYL